MSVRARAGRTGALVDDGVKGVEVDGCEKGGNNSSRSMSSERWCMRRGGAGLVIPLSSLSLSATQSMKEGWEGLVRGSVEAAEERLEWRWPIVL